MAQDIWIMDADNINVARGKNTFLQTESIKRFLETENDLQSFIVATKGIGKTMLLKMKRETFPDNIVIPESGIDKFSFGNNLSRESVDLFTDIDNVASLWTISIILTVLKRVKFAFDANSVSSSLNTIYSNKNLITVSEFFTHLIHSDRNDFFRAKNDLETLLVPLFRREVNTNIVIFIDNIDEYFNKHLSNLFSESVTGYLKPELWYSSQMGLVLSFFALHKLNHHVKLFACIRKEAFLRYQKREALFQQLIERTLDLKFSTAELERIYGNNIVKEAPDRFMKIELLKKDPIQAYFGFKNIRHKQVNVSEAIFQYVVRHTLYRPRDLMQIGKKLSDIPKSERNPQKIREVVHDEAKTIVDIYLAEVKPHIREIEIERVLSLIETNALTKQDLHTICGLYNGTSHQHCNRTACKQCGNIHVFCTLYKIGFLGYVYNDGTKNTRMQKFFLPGEKIFEPDNILPESEFYLIHPILNSMIAMHNDKYIDRRNKNNIVGNGLIWFMDNRNDYKISRKKVAVLKADIRDFSSLMHESDTKTIAVKERLQKLINPDALECEYVKTNNGDSLTIVEKNAEKVVKAAFKLLDTVRRLDLDVRIAVDYGYVSFKKGIEETGLPILFCSRIEPLVADNQIWCTEALASELRKKTQIYNLTDLFADTPPKLASRKSAAGFLINKSDQKEIVLKLYRIKRDD